MPPRGVMCRSTARAWLPAAAVLVLLLLLFGALAQPEDAPSATDTGDAAAGNTTNDTASTDKPVGVAEELLQRLAQDIQQTGPGSSSMVSGTDSSSNTETTAELPDFSSTANALAQQAVREGGAKAAALAQQQAALDAYAGSNSTTTSSSSADTAAMQLLELQQQTANSSSPDNSSSSDDSQVAGLQLLLQTIRQQWQASGNRQRQRQQQQQQQQSGSGTQSTAAVVNVTQQWLTGLDDLAAKYPSLSGFSRLAHNSSAFMREISQTQQLPAIILAPTNAALGDYLLALRTLKAQADSSGANGGGSTAQDVAGDSGPPPQPSVQQLVDDVLQDTATSLVLLRRHFIPARQPHLLDGTGSINSQLLERGSTPLVFTSLVLKTSLGSFIQVSQMPPGFAGGLLARLNSMQSTAPATMLSAGSNTAGSSNDTSSTSSSIPGNVMAGSSVSLLHVGQGGIALAHPFVLRPTPTLVVPVDSVLTEIDEVVNSRTAARLRGAFGWSPEDEQALLSAVYLDPDREYWTQTIGPSSGAGAQSVMGFAGPSAAGAAQGPAAAIAGQSNEGSSRGASSAGGSDAGSSSSSSSSGNTSGSGSSSSGSNAAAAPAAGRAGSGVGRRVRRLQQALAQGSPTMLPPSDKAAGANAAASNPQATAEGNPGVVGSSGAGAGPASVAEGNPGAGGSGSSSSGSSGISGTAGPVAEGNPGAVGSSATGNGSSNGATGSANGTTDRGSSSSGEGAVDDTGSGNGSGGGIGSRGGGATGAAGGSGVPAFVAETRARQQQMLIQMQMSDALAANLMTIEAIRAWVSAAVLNPAAVFDPESLVGLPTVPTAAANATGTLRGNNSNTSIEIRDVDAGKLSDTGSCWGRSYYGKRVDSSSSSSSSNSEACSLVDWSSTCIGAPCSPICSSSGSSDPATARGESCSEARRPAGKLNNSGSSSTGLPSTQPHPKYCSRLNTALIVGLSPYQLFPSFGLPGVFSSNNSSSSSRSNADLLLGNGNSPGSSSKDGSSSSGNSGNRRRHGARRALSQSSSNDDSSGSSAGESSTSATSGTSATSATSATSLTSSPSSPSDTSSSSSPSPSPSPDPTAPSSSPGPASKASSPSPSPPPAPSPTHPGSPSQEASKDTAGGSSSGSSSSEDNNGGNNAGSLSGSAGSNGSSDSNESSIRGNDRGSSSNSSNSRGSGSAPKPQDLVFLPVTQLAKMLVDGSVTSQQLVSAFRDWLQQYDSTLHAAVTITYALADSQAAAAQQAITSAAATTSSATANTGKDAEANDSNSDNQQQAVATGSSAVSLLSGVPYGLKDLFAVPGYPTTWGLSALKNRTIDTPSWAYSALSGPAGGVLLAKTATGELAWGDTWFDTITTRNPWKTDTGSCGSSAGSAAAVAAGLLPYAIGSETWGSIVCPATTVGVSAFRPTGGTIPTNGLLQVSPTLDKTGIFCRQLLDCAVVADALMDTQASSPTGNSAGCSAGCNSTSSTARLHRQSPAEAAAFNYTAFQQQQLSGGNTTGATPTASAQAAAVTGSVFPATFQELPLLSELCIGYLPGISSKLLSVLKSLSPACLKGPLPVPGDPHMVRDVLPTIMQAEVAISYEGLWLEGFIDQRNHWWPSIQLGQLAPAATYLRAQQLRALLLQQTKQYFRHNGIHVLLKPARSSVGLDGLAALVDMPEALLPVEMGTTTFDDADPVQSGSTDVSAGSSTASGSSQSGGSTGSSDASSNQTWTQPKVNAIIALPGEDAVVIAVAAAFQSVTDVHLQRPPLPTAAGSSNEAQAATG